METKTNKKVRKLDFEVTKGITLKKRTNKASTRMMSPTNGSFSIEGLLVGDYYRLFGDNISEDDDDFEFPTVLTVEGYVFPADACWDFANALSADCELIASAICDDTGWVRPEFCSADPVRDNRTVIFIDRIVVPEEYRNMGVFDCFLSCLPQLVAEIDSAAVGVFLAASPFELLKRNGEDEEYLAAQKRLIKGYKWHGFKQVEKESIVMYLEDNNWSDFDRELYFDDFD